MLLLFTYSHYDFGDKQKLENRHWQSLKLLYENVKKYMEKSDDLPFNVFNFDDDQRALIEYIPTSFFRSERCNDLYKVNSWLNHIQKAIKLKEKNQPQIVFQPRLGGGLELAVISKDYEGSLCGIAGTCYEYGIDIQQASGCVIPSPYELSMDFLNIKLPDIKTKLNKVDPNIKNIDIESGEVEHEYLEKFNHRLSEVVGNKLSLDLDIQDILSRINPRYVIDGFGNNKYRITIRFGSDQPGILYSFTRLLSDVGNIKGFKTYNHSNGEITDSFTLTSEKTQDEIRNDLDKYLIRQL